MRRAGVFRALPGWPKLIAQITFATAGMVVSLVWLTPGLDVWLDLSLVPRLGLAAGVCTVGMVVYGALLLLVGIRPSALRA